MRRSVRVVALALAVAGGAACFPSYDGLASAAPDEEEDGGYESPQTKDAQSHPTLDAEVHVDEAAAPAPTCTDGLKNGKETDVDCGGGDCPPCAQGQGCAGTGDCVATASSCLGQLCCKQYIKSTGGASGNVNICCDGTDVRVAVRDCAVGANHFANASGPNCAAGGEGANNGGNSCAEVTCALCK